MDGQAGTDESASMDVERLGAQVGACIATHLMRSSVPWPSFPMGEQKLLARSWNITLRTRKPRQEPQRADPSKSTLTVADTRRHGRPMAESTQTQERPVTHRIAFFVKNPHECSDNPQANFLVARTRTAPTGLSHCAQRCYIGTHAVRSLKTFHFFFFFGLRPYYR